MDLYSPKTIKELLLTPPKDHMGQNFLVEKRVASKILTASELSSKDSVLEVGAGLGTLTLELAKRVKRVVAVEKDPKLVKILKETLKDFPKVEVVGEDILTLNLTKLNCTKAVANLPYYASSPIIRLFLESEHAPELMVFMVQKEVAQRICATPPDMSLLAVSVQFYAEPEIVSLVSKGAFWPRPKVDSAVLKLVPREKRRTDTKKFFRVVKAGFSHPRKQLLNNLSSQLKVSRGETALWLEKNGVHPIQRAETLSLSDWEALSRSLPS